jgi:hypothetical protein
MPETGDSIVVATVHIFIRMATWHGVSDSLAQGAGARMAGSVKSHRDQRQR